MSEPRGSTYQVGDRVAIVGSTHPHRGQLGVISAPAAGTAKTLAGMDWEVQLEEGQVTAGCFVREVEIRPERPDGPSTLEQVRAAYPPMSEQIARAEENARHVEDRRDDV